MPERADVIDLEAANFELFEAVADRQRAVGRPFRPRLLEHALSAQIAPDRRIRRYPGHTVVEHNAQIIDMQLHAPAHDWLGAKKTHRKLSRGNWGGLSRLDALLEWSGAAVGANGPAVAHSGPPWDALGGAMARTPFGCTAGCPARNVGTKLGVRLSAARDSVCRHCSAYLIQVQRVGCSGSVPRNSCLVTVGAWPLEAAAMQA